MQFHWSSLPPLLVAIAMAHSAHAAQYTAQLIDDSNRFGYAAINNLGQVALAGTNGRIEGLSGETYRYTDNVGLEFVSRSAVGGGPPVVNINNAGVVLSSFWGPFDKPAPIVGQPGLTTTLGAGGYGGFDVSYRHSTRERFLNDNGQVIGVADFAVDHAAARYTPGVGVVRLEQLGALPVGYANASALAINNSGQVTGVFSSLTDTPDTAPSSRATAYRLTDGVGIVSLGQLGNNLTDYSEGQVINASGQVAGIATIGFLTHAFRYTDGVGMVDIVPSSLGDVSVHEVSGINDSGQVAGMFYFRTGGGYGVFRYSDDRGFEIFPSSGEYESFEALGINRRGQVFGNYLSKHSGGGFLIDSDGSFVDLAGVVARLGYDHHAVLGFNDEGQILLEATRVLADQTAYSAILRLDPSSVGAVPEPASVLLGVAGLMALGFARRSGATRC